MRFTISAAVLAFAATVLGQTDGFDAMTAPIKDENVPAGETYNIVWQPGTYTGTVSLALLGGATASTLQVLDTFASNIDNTAGGYAWTVDSSLGDDATYGIKITLDSDTSIFQYSFPFHITGSSVSSSSSSASSSAAGYPTAEASSSAAAVTTATSKAAESTTVAASSSVAASSTVVVESSTAAEITSSFPTYTATANSSSVATGSAGVTTLSTATSTKTSTGSSSSSTPTTVTTNGAPRAAAGSFALLAGIAAAIFAL